VGVGLGVEVGAIEGLAVAEARADGRGPGDEPLPLQAAIKTIVAHSADMLKNERLLRTNILLSLA
jgi:hypothetical protein